MLVRVEAPHFVAGLVLENDVCILAAPILRKYGCMGRSREHLSAYFRRRGWKATVVRELEKKA